MYAVKLAAIACIPLVAGLISDWRDFINAVWASTALTLAAFAALSELLTVHTLLVLPAILALSLLIALGPLLICIYLLHNALSRTPREPAPIPRVPSLLLGLALLVLIVVAVAAQPFSAHQLSIASTVIVLLFGYITAEFGLFVLASRLRRRDRRGLLGYFVVVLGSGLLPGGQVPPLLASRLDRGIAVFSSLTARGREPVLIVSGGKGSNGQVSEASAMAGYLKAHGVRPDSVLLEEESRTTEENLANSAALMQQVCPGASAVIVTSDFHVLRTAMLASRLELNAQVTGAATDPDRWPSATVREFGAVFLSYKLNLAVCLLTVALPLTYLALSC